MTRYEKIKEGGKAELAKCIAFLMFRFYEEEHGIEQDCNLLKTFVEKDSPRWEKWLDEEVD